MLSQIREWRMNGNLNLNLFYIVKKNIGLIILKQLFFVDILQGNTDEKVQL